MRNATLIPVFVGAQLDCAWIGGADLSGAVERRRDPALLP
jgi:hypothetical protein